MNDWELWLLMVSVTLIVIWGISEAVSRVPRWEDDRTAYWKRKIAENGQNQKWGKR